MNIDFTNKVVIVTGGASGIGEAIVNQFAAAGARVIVFDIKKASGGFAADSYLVDISQPQQIQDAVDQVVNDYKQIDILINNAGGAFIKGLDNSVENTDNQLFTDTLNVNLSGTYYCSKAVLPIMKQQASGVITHIGSVNSKQAIGHPAYSAAKAGLLSLSRSIAVEYGESGIRSNVVIPGTVKTPNWQERLEKNPKVLDELKRYYPIGDIAEPDDIANAVCFLSSTQARFITGTELVVDGGLTAGSRQLMAEVTVEN